MTPFSEDVSKRLQSAGLVATIISESLNDIEFGNAYALFQVDELLLRFVRDRGQVFLEIAARSSSKFYPFDDVEIAMGWKSIDEVLERKQPEEIDLLLEIFAKKRGEIESAFSLEQAKFFKKRLERAAQMRGIAFADRLREIAKNRGDESS